MTHSTFDPTGDPERSGSTMPPLATPGIEISEENEGRLLIVKLIGKLHKDDYRHFLPVVQKAIGRYGKVRMLVQMLDFHGWDAGALWEDIKFDVKHFNDIERLAMVGERTWEKWMVICCKPFTTAKMRYFPVEELAEARTWIMAA